MWFGVLVCEMGERGEICMCVFYCLFVCCVIWGLSELEFVYM
jgi:hypothetical protein